MPYTKQTWVNDSSPLNATRMNYIEQGIFDAMAAAEGAGSMTEPSPQVTNGPVYWNGSTWVSAKLTNAQIDAAAAIAYSKLALTGQIANADISSAAAIAYSKLALSGSIVNADISTSAAIVGSKLNAARVATTVGGLGTAADGAFGVVRTGTTPYDFMPLVYDATYTKWVSPQIVAIGGAAHGASGSSATWEDTLSNAGNALIPYKTFTDAGLTLQVRVLGVITGGGATIDLGARLLGYNVDAAVSQTGADTAMATTTGTGVLKQSGWTTPGAITATDYAQLNIRFRTSVNNTGTLDRGTLLYRWVG